MARVIPVEVRVADMAIFKRMLDATVALLRALAAYDGPLPQTVMDAADDLRKALAELGGRDIGPPP